MAHNVSHQSQLDSRSLLLTGKMSNCKKVEEEVNMLSHTDWCWGNGLLTTIHSTQAREQDLDLPATTTQLDVGYHQMGLYIGSM